MGQSAFKITRPTYEDLLKVPDDRVAEIIAGELVVSPRPAIPHTVAASIMGSDVIGPFHRRPGDPGGPGGWWIMNEPELHLGDEVFVPDLAGWRRARLPVLRPAPYFELAPDWVCEVISPSTERIDRSFKMQGYARAGVRWLWLVNPLTQVLEIYGLEAGRWVRTAVHTGRTSIQAEPFEAVTLDMGRWWLEEEEAPDEPPAGGETREQASPAAKKFR